MSLSRSACHFARSFSRSSRSELSRLACAYLIALRLACAVLNARSSASVFTGAAGPSEASHALKSRFMPYHSTDEQFGSRGPLSHAAAPQQEVVLRILIDDARDVGVDDGRAFFLEHLDRVGHRLGLRLVEAAARFLLSRRRDAVVVVRARDADARALQPFALEERRVVAIRRRLARLGRRIVRIGRRALRARRTGSPRRSRSSPSVRRCPDRR